MIKMYSIFFKLYRDRATPLQLHVEAATENCMQHSYMPICIVCSYNNFMLVRPAQNAHPIILFQECYFVGYQYVTTCI